MCVNLRHCLKFGTLPNPFKPRPTPYTRIKSLYTLVIFGTFKSRLAGLRSLFNDPNLQRRNPQVLAAGKMPKFHLRPSWKFGLWGNAGDSV